MSKPKCKLSGFILDLVLIAEAALKKEGLNHEAEVMREKAFRSNSQEEALSIILEYVDPDETRN